MTAYLTPYNGLLCQTCALDTAALVGGGTRWLDRLTAIPVRDVISEWGEACCEECQWPFADVDGPA